MSSTETTFRQKENLTPIGRFAESLIIPGMLLLFGFLYLHQLRDTGFFTGEFGTLEQIALYGPILLALIAPAVRVIAGRRNPGRPFEIIDGLALALGSLWLLIVFPFDYSYLPDVLPNSLQWTLSWVVDWMARVVLVIQVIAGPLGAVTNTIEMIKQSGSGPGKPAAA